MENNEKYLEETNKIKEFILNFEEDQCIDKFFKYISSCNAIDGSFEYKFIKKLDKFLENFVSYILRKAYETFDKDYLVDIALLYEMEGTGALMDSTHFEIADRISFFYEDNQAHPFIKEYMYNVFCSFKDDIILTDKERKIYELENEYQIIKKELTEREEKINEIQEKLRELKK